MSGNNHHRIAAVEPPASPPPPVGVDLDETDYSTSFAETTTTNASSSENQKDDSVATVSDNEGESRMYNDANGLSSPFHDFGSVFRVRKKRLTNHWKSFVHPLMWRCKWAELKIKQFESQAMKYAKKIAECDLTKHLASNQSIPEGFSSRSMPYTQRRRRKLLKRRKRLRVEETTNADLYMSQHVLFSYHDSKKLDPDEISMLDDLDEPEQNTTSQEVVDLNMHTNWSFLENGDNDMEQILQKIDLADSRVQKLKAQLDLVISENVQMFPSDAQTSAVHSPTFSTCKVETVSVGGLCGMTRHNSELDMEGLEMSEHAVSNYGEDFHIPDIIESTVGTLSSVDVTRHQPQIGDSCEKILDNMLVHDETAEAEKHALRSCQHQALKHEVVVKQETAEAERKSCLHDVIVKNTAEAERHALKGCLHEVIVKQERVKSEEEEESIHQHAPMESDTATKDAVPQEQSTLKSCLVTEFQIPKNKRKRGERKAGSGNWSRQCPGEPDN